MTGAVEKTSGGTTLESVTYTYDALGNRIGMDENSTQTWTLYDRGQPDHGLQRVRLFDNAATCGDRWASLRGRHRAGRCRGIWPITWARVRDLINNSGAIIDHVDFSAFGTVLDQSNPTSGDRMMGFAGMERDTVTGLNLAVFREENPATGRWDSQDPLEFGGGQPNLYGYVGNEPADASDPNGTVRDWLDHYAEWYQQHGRPGFWEGLIPIWGSGRTAYDDYAHGKPYWGTFWVGVAVTDITLIRSLATAGIKGLWKGGSHT